MKKLFRSDRLAIHYWSNNESVFNPVRREAWKQVFRAWRKIVDSYHRITGDLAWWNTEIANVSFLASAIWRTDQIAVQEYGVSRRVGRQSARGRGDLWASVGEASYLFEAKILWHALNSQGTVPLIAAEIANAMQQARLYDEDREFLGAMVFANAYTSDPSKIRHKIDTWRATDRKELMATASHGIVVDYHPALTPNAIVWNESYNPGTTIVLAFDRIPDKK